MFSISVRSKSFEHESQEAALETLRHQTFSEVIASFWFFKLLCNNNKDSGRSLFLYLQANLLKTERLLCSSGLEEQVKCWYMDHLYTQNLHRYNQLRKQLKMLKSNFYLFNLPGFITDYTNSMQGLLTFSHKKLSSKFLNCSVDSVGLCVQRWV